ncbi:MAG: lipopolysaccharide/colanic/teichoic acid biosynthesis glycosyltransferase [Pirellulaceae bacterium]|jgi:lipopolysaccharide/colanic/teichoic acid biosynthesis glycosyltransferase
MSSTQTSNNKGYRPELTEELYRRFAVDTQGAIGFMRRIQYWRKRYMWLMVIRSAQFIKRAIDIVGAVVAFVLFSPVLLAVGLLIKFTDNGPIMFWQKRVGQWGREFEFPKFRSMVVNAEELKDKLLEQNDHNDSITFKMKHDPRVTWIGRIIRKLSIDELPQLWCVLVGDMSLVGPRPPVPREVAEYSLADRRRLDATPGLTCTWQVSGRGDIPFDQQVELDVSYIESQSFWLDLKLLFQTVPAVLLGKGAY